MSRNMVSDAWMMLTLLPSISTHFTGTSYPTFALPDPTLITKPNRLATYKISMSNAHLSKWSEGKTHRATLLENILNPH